MHFLIKYTSTLHLFEKGIKLYRHTSGQVYIWRMTFDLCR